MGHVERTLSADRSISGMIVNAVADAAGVDPQELSPPLYDVVAPDALEALFGETGGRTTPTTLSFEYGDYAVTVVGEGGETIVDVTPLTDAAPDRE